jgi:hypothetical protein
MRTLPPRIQRRNDEADAVKRWHIDKLTAIRAINEYGKANKHEYSPHCSLGDACGAMGHRDSCYVLPNGMVFETYLSNGWMTRGLLWKSRDDLETASRYMPSNIYWEF